MAGFPINYSNFKGVVPVSRVGLEMIHSRECLLAAFNLSNIHLYEFNEEIAIYTKTSLPYLETERN